MKRLLVCGDRNWTDEAAIERELQTFNPDQWVVITGGARGADSIAHKVAVGLGFSCEVYPALWQDFGRAAGPIRNQEMLDTGLDKALAFHADLDNSKGTKDMVRRCRKAGVPTKVITS